MEAERNEKARFIFEYFFYNKNDEFVKSKKFTCATEKEAEGMANDISNNWIRVNHRLYPENGLDQTNQ